MDEGMSKFWKHKMNSQDRKRALFKDIVKEANLSGSTELAVLGQQLGPQEISNVHP